MAGIDITVDVGLQSGLLSGDGTGVANLIESMLNQALAAQAVMMPPEQLAMKGKMAAKRPLRHTRL